MIIPGPGAPSDLMTGYSGEIRQLQYKSFESISLKNAPFALYSINADNLQHEKVSQ